MLNCRRTSAPETDKGQQTNVQEFEKKKSILEKLRVD
jgi:hypothetical protein